MCEDVGKVLGLDWVLLFLQPGLHSTTVVWGLRILVALTSVQPILQKFKDGTSNGGWLRHTDHNRVALALGNYVSIFTHKFSIPKFNYLISYLRLSSTNAQR